MTDKASRVVFIFLSVFSAEGGIQSYVKDVLAAYAHQDGALPADIYLLRDCPEDIQSWQGEQKFRFFCFGDGTRNIGRLRLSWALAKSLLGRQYKKVICGHVLLSPLLSPLCAWSKTPLIVMTYGKEVWQPLQPRQQRALKEAQDIWTISRYSRNLACSANNLDPSKFRMLPCIVDGDAFAPGSANAHLCQTYGLEGHRVLMTVARLWSGDIYKGVDVTIRALPKILQACPDVKYLVVGRGDDQPRLAQMAQDLGVADHVMFAGYVADEALADHYRLADAYVMPSREGFGIVYLEAMACGVPTLSGDDDGSADPLQDGKVGWRVPYRDAEAVATACIEILRGDDQRCDGDWLRTETLKVFGKETLQQRIAELLPTA